jgi:hypothetical protein
MKNTFLLALLLLWMNNAFSQSSTGDVIGTVLDADSKKPMEFVKAIVWDNDKKYQASRWCLSKIRSVSNFDCT